MSNEDTNIYYNFTFYNESDFDKSAIINNTRVQNILERPSDYKMAVVRFNIPAINIPIINNFKDNYYYVRLEYDGEFSQIYMTQIPNEIPNAGRIWNYQEFINSINNALIASYNQLKLLKPLMPQTIPPKVVIAYDTKKIEIFFETTYDSTIPNNTKVIFNKKLYNAFPTIESFALENNQEFAIIVKDNLINKRTISGIDYYAMYEESSSLFLINDFNDIQFESDNIPISPELIDGNKNITRRVLTDFEGIQQINNRSAIQYFPQGPLRWIDLKSNHPLRDTDLRVYYTTKSGDTYPLKVPPLETLTVKLLFRKKNDDGTFEYT